MSAAMKFSLLALLGSAAAHPSLGHAKYHQKPAGAKPYPVGGWSGNYNSTRVAYPTATGLSVDDKSTTTIDLTTTSTTTLYTTIYGTASPVTSVGIKDIPTGAAGCGPATVTVTASEKVTVTVTPGGGANAPKSSATPVASQAGGDYGYPAPSPPAVEKPTAAAEKPATSQAEGYPVNTPTPSAAISSAVAISSAAPVSSAAPASSAAPSSSAAPKPSGSPSYTGTKRGLAYNDGNLCSKFASRFGFAYNWGQTESSDVGAPFVPMMHKPSDSSADEWLANVEKAVKGGSKAVMGFNEPDIAAQANLTPEAACSAWKEYMNPIAESHSDVTIIGPGVSNSNIDGQGLTWLSKFQAVCPDATIHSTNVHFYDIYDEGTLDRFQAHVEKAISMTNKPVWVTEFGLNPGSASPEQAAEFLKGCMKYLDGNDKVQGYSYFMVGTGEHQLNTAGGLSPLGEIYASSN
jgi:hypothetical protein